MTTPLGRVGCDPTKVHGGPQLGRTAHKQLTNGIQSRKSIKTRLNLLLLLSRDGAPADAFLMPLPVAPLFTGDFAQSAYAALRALDVIINVATVCLLLVAIIASKSERLLAPAALPMYGYALDAGSSSRAASRSFGCCGRRGAPRHAASRSGAGQQKA